MLDFIMFIIMCIITLLLDLIDQITDALSIFDNHQSANHFLNYAALCQLISIFIHSMITYHFLVSKTYKSDQSRLTYGFLWRSRIRQFMSLMFFVLGLGGFILKVDLLVDIFQKETKYHF